MCISGVNGIYDFSAICSMCVAGHIKNVSSSIGRTEDLKMLETIIIVVCAVVCIGAAGFAWWMENGPDKGNDIRDDVKFHTEDQNLK